MSRPKNRRSQRRAVRRSKHPVLAALVSIALLSAAVWLGSEKPTGEAIRAGVSLPDLTLSDISLPAPSWSPLDPLRTAPFRLGSIDFVGLETLAASELLAQLPLEPIALIDVDPEAVCRRLRAAQPRIATCEAARLPPRRLVVHIRERQALAVVQASGAGLDASGVSFALGPGEGAQLPRISGDLPAALAALLEANRRKLAARSVHAEWPDDILVELAGPAPSLRLGADIALGMDRWQAAVAQRPADELRDMQLDARFRGQVVLRPLAAVNGEGVLELGGE